MRTAPYEKRWINARECITSYAGKNARLTKSWQGTITEQVALFDTRDAHVTSLATTALEGAAMECWHDFESNRELPVAAATLSFLDFSAALSGRFAIAPDLDPRDRMLQMSTRTLRSLLSGLPRQFRRHSHRSTSTHRGLSSSTSSRSRFSRGFGLVVRRVAVSRPCRRSSQLPCQYGPLSS